MLADENGNILYLFTVDERNVSNCSGGCAGFWPPLLTEGDPEAGSGATADLLGTIIRADDTVQVTYNGWPLYYYSQDQDPGDALGQDVNGVWFVLGVNGGPVQTSAVVSTGTHPELGTILVDASGRSMYLFTPDERNVSNCAGVCRDFWPPVLTVDDPQAMGDAAANALGTIASPDGSKMVTYNGWPLYYYKFDERPGDALGQTVNDVWWVLSVHGGPIYTDITIGTSDHAELGNILTDPSGRTLYLFTPDSPRVSVCSGGCAQAWPPVLTIGTPQSTGGAVGVLLSTFERDDGGMQVAYNGQPLYYYAFDDAPGDANGQRVNDVWFVLNTSGVAVETAIGEQEPTPPPETPSVGDPAVGRLALIALGVSVLLISGGGALLMRRRSRA